MRRISNGLSYANVTSTIALVFGLGSQLDIFVIPVVAACVVVLLSIGLVIRSRQLRDPA